MLRRTWCSCRWPTTRRAEEFAGRCGDRFARVRRPRGRLDLRLGSASAWQGDPAERLGLLIHDEPHEGSDIGPLLAWARAIRAAEPDVIIWEDPTYRDPAAAPAELFEVCDVLCPNRPMWLPGREPLPSSIAISSRGRTARSNSTPAPARPGCSTRTATTGSRRGTAGTRAARARSSGPSATTAAPRRWNEYFAKRGPFTPLFLDDQIGHRRQADGGHSRERRGLRVLRHAPACRRGSPEARRFYGAIAQAEKVLETARHRAAHRRCRTTSLARTERSHRCGSM